MTDTDRTRDDQRQMWNGPGADAWIGSRNVLDAMFRPIETMLVDAVRATGARRVLDVGCGTGSTTLAIAEALGDDGSTLGLDLSEPMIAVATSRATELGSPARFLAADAATHPFAAGEFDLIVSRFGVMFFADPVAAFANLRRAAQPGAGTFLVTWRSPAENPFMTTAERAAAALMPDFPKRRSDGPGQFGLADPDHVHGILSAAGWRDVALAPVDVACAFPAEELRQFATRLGPLGTALRGVDAELAARVSEAVMAAFGTYVVGDEVRFTAACWVVRARA
jgi:SAM-dependent methyltransferase